MSGSDELWRYLRSNASPPAAFVPEAEEHRLAAIIAAWERHADSFLGPTLLAGAIRAEVRLADLEGRSPREFAIAQQTKPSPPPMHPAPPAPPVPPPTLEGTFERVETDSIPSHVDEAPPRSGEDLEW